MKYYATESSLNAAKRERLEQQMAEFLAKGGAITEVDNKGNFIKVDTPSFSVVTKKSKMTENNKAAIKAKEDRLKVQRPILELYSETVTIKEKWSYLSRYIGGIVKPWQLKKVAFGLSSIPEQKVFDVVEKAIEKIIIENEKFKDMHRDKIAELKRKGFSCNEKINRIIMQQPVLLRFQDAFSDEDNCWKILSDALDGKISQKHLRSVAKGETSIQSEQRFKMLEKTINNLIDEKINGKVVA